MMSGLVIAVAGGSFNPVHMGHMAIGEAVEEALKPDKILFIPSFIHPDKGKGFGATPDDRMMMLKLAIADRPGWEISDIEYKMPQISYTVKTIEKLLQWYGSETLIYFICGADIMYTIHTWREPHRLFQLFRFAVVQRPGYATDAFLRQVELVKARYGGHIEIIECRQVAISSSEIRERIGRGCSISGLLPERVEKYIIDNQLYKTSD